MNSGLPDPKPNEDVSHVMHHTEPSGVVEQIELTRGQRGGIGWVIRAATVDRIKELDEQLAKIYAAELNPPAKP
jgi:hypothetical protein